MTGPEEDGAAPEPLIEPSFDPRAIEALICPRTHARLDWDAARSELVSRKAGLAYPVRDGIPIMLESEARSLTD